MPLSASDGQCCGCAPGRLGRGTFWSLAALCLAGLLAGCATTSRAPVEDRSSAGAAKPDTYTVRKNDTLYSIAWRHNLEYRALAEANGIRPPFTVYPGQNIRLLGTPAGAAPAASVSAKPSATASRPARPASQPASPPTVRRAEDSQRPDIASTPTPPKPPPALPTPSVPSRPAAAPTPTEKSPSPKPAAPPKKLAPAKPQPPAPRAAGQWLRPVAARPVRGFGGGSNGLDYALPPRTEVRAAAPGVVVYAGPGLGGFRHLVIVKASERYLVAYGVNATPKLQEGDTVASGATVAQVGDGDAAARRFHFEVRDRGKPVDPTKLIGSG